MNKIQQKPAQLDLALAWFLSTGTWLASAIIAIWLILPLFGLNPTILLPYSNIRLPFVTIGIAVIILLPILRVFMMFIAFLKKSDYRFAAIAALVLLILLCSFAIGATTA